MAEPMPPWTAAAQEEILAGIADGTWPAGTYLPALDALADELELDAATVTRALDELTDQGVVRPGEHGHEVLRDHAATPPAAATADLHADELPYTCQYCMNTLADHLLVFELSIHGQPSQRFKDLVCRACGHDAVKDVASRPRRTIKAVRLFRLAATEVFTATDDPALQAVDAITLDRKASHEPAAGAS